jgi:hypothetical protein
MLRGSSDQLQRSARHLVPLIETIAEAPAVVAARPVEHGRNRPPGSVGRHTRDPGLGQHRPEGDDECGSS